MAGGGRGEQGQCPAIHGQADSGNGTNRTVIFSTAGVLRPQNVCCVAADPSLCMRAATQSACQPWRRACPQSRRSCASRPGSPTGRSPLAVRQRFHQPRVCGHSLAALAAAPARTAGCGCCRGRLWRRPSRGCACGWQRSCWPARRCTSCAGCASMASLIRRRCAQLRQQRDGRG